jgi:hypothetical protein
MTFIPVYLLQLITNTADIITTFRENIDLIQGFLTDPEYENIGCLEISRSTNKA